MEYATLEPIQHGTQEKNIAFYDHMLPRQKNSIFGEFSAHWHSEYEIIYVLQGPVCFSLNETVYRVESGQALFVNRKVIHASLIDDLSHPIHYICVTFGEQFLFSNTLDVLYKQYFFPLHTGHKQLPPYIAGTEKWQKKMLNLIDALCISGLEKPRGCELEWRILLLQFFHTAYVYDVFINKTPENDSNITAIQSALLTIQKNYTNPIQISDLAKSAGFSMEHFCRIFKSITGKTPNEYIISCRIQQAEHLLLHTTDNVSNIAAACGFSDMNYFSRYFKKVHGVTPSQYRNIG